MRRELILIACAASLMLIAPLAAVAAEPLSAPVAAAAPTGATGATGETGATGAAPPPSSAEQRQEAEEAADEVEEEDEQPASPAALAAEIAEVLRRVQQETSEEEAVPRRAPAAEHCVVPRLTDDTLRHAEHALARAHCKLGRVKVPRGRHSRLVVVTQSKRAGERLADRAAVGVRLAPPRHKSA